MLTLFIALSVATISAQDPHPATSSHAAMAMGFDQDKTAHHFYLNEDGGAIDVAVTDLTDTRNRDAIRSHLPHITMMFGTGDFAAPMLVHESKDVPGTAVLARLKERVTYSYVETPAGGRVNIVTRDPDALAAVHQFLRYQIAEHHTGDSLAVSARR